MNTSSDPSSMRQNDKLLLQPGKGWVRMPISEPLALANSASFSAAVPSAGLIAVVAPRTSLL
jgi:hypothetical protein